MSTEVITALSSPVKEQSEKVTKMDTSVNDVEPANMNGSEDTSAEVKAGKRKRSTKKSSEAEEVSTPNIRPRRTIPKRDETPLTPLNDSAKANKTKAQRNSEEQADADDEQEHDKNIPIVHDVADVIWVKIGGHPWWPSLIIRDPNDATRCFTKISGSARAKRMYFVVFYGSTADFAWVADAAIIPYKGVEAFTKYAQEMVDKAQTKSQKEQLTERFQLKVTIGRREDWEMAVREADDAIKQTSETRLEEIEPKLQFYTSKITTSKGQPGRKSKASTTKPEDSVESSTVATSSMNPMDRSLLAEKTFEFKSEDESSNDEPRVRKTPSVKIKFKSQTPNDADSSTTPPAKRRYVRNSSPPKDNRSVAAQASNGQSVLYQSRTPTDIKETPTGNENSTGRKRGRPRLSKPSVITANGATPKQEFNEEKSLTTAKSTSSKPAITKPQAFRNTSNPVGSMNNVLVGQHHRFDTRIGFLSPYEEQEIFNTIDHLRSTKTLEEAEKIAKQRFEQILSVNLNKIPVDIPQDWFYSFLFAHPILIVKNSHWFDEKKPSDSLIDNDLLNDVNRTQSSSSLKVLKHQLSILSKFYHNELQIRQPGVNAKE